jgi:hypothetical protein
MRDRKEGSGVEDKDTLSVEPNCYPPKRSAAMLNVEEDLYSCCQYTGQKKGCGNCEGSQKREQTLLVMTGPFAASVKGEKMSKTATARAAKKVKIDTLAMVDVTDRRGIFSWDWSG